MVKKLKKENEKVLLDFLLEEKEWNLFMIGDLINFGFEEEFLEYWGDYNKNQKLNAVLMRFYDSFIIYSEGKYDTKGFAKVMSNYDYHIISGKESTVNQMTDEVTVDQKRKTYYAVLRSEEKLPDITLKTIEKTKIKDLESLLTLQENEIDEFDHNPSLERIKKRYLSGTGRGYHVKDERGNIISSVETSAENPYAAMIIGVCTHPAYRNKGYAAQLLIKICQEVLDEDKSLCLFYDNPSAGKIYKRIGFESLGQWSIWKKE
jgi:predicted GNAT family acetyltransferase